MFKKILIANRGEIACRIAKTCQRLSIKTVAVYSDADREALHVQRCDEAYHLGGSLPKDSYLLGDKIIQIALRSGAQAIHPGYGFLSENALFAKACQEAGIKFIGPSATAIESMGSKSAAKSLMEKAAVPLVPGYHGENQDPTFLLEHADRIGYPVLLKASAGGGGKGMRIVDSHDMFEQALASCQREAMSSFGNAQVLLEKYLQRPRHIEVQIFSDQQDNYVYLFDRDCSVQRRHQKVVEEAPAPNVSPALKKAMGEAAIQAARAVQYEGAGTVEFIANTNEQGEVEGFYFMEMNTRLQVEHPVTEMITGQDLVEWQLRVAFGQPLPLLQHQLEHNGHAIEARIYAENPEKQFLPSMGKLRVLHFPQEVTQQIRIDTGVGEGDVISPFYDPMIAKLIVWGKTRQEAIEKLSTALAKVRILGLFTNVAFLGRLMHCPDFMKPQLDTSLIDRNATELLQGQQNLDVVDLLLLVARKIHQEQEYQKKYAREFNSPWAVQDGWSMMDSKHRNFSWMHLESADTTTLTLTYNYVNRMISYLGQEYLLQFSAQGDAVSLHWAQGLVISHVIADPIQPTLLHLFRDGAHQVWQYLDPFVPLSDHAHQFGNLSAPMPGKVTLIHVQVGDQVKAGDALVVLEAMKMEHTIIAPKDGEVEEIYFTQGSQVQEGHQLIRFKSGQA